MISLYLRCLSAILKNNSGIIPYPSFVTFIITWRCNLQCIMCDIWKKDESYEMPLKEIDAIFKQLKPLDVIRITGGEPFLREDIAEIVNILNKRVKPIIIYITTNGTLKDRIISFVKKAGYLSNLYIKISIDATREEHNRIRGNKESYDRAISTLSELSDLRKRYGFYLGVNQTIASQKCLDDRDKLKCICNKYGTKLYSVFAFSKPPLYKPKHLAHSNQKDKTALFSSFNQKEMIKVLKVFKKDIKYIDNFIEKLVQKYYLKGLFARLIYGKNKPSPKCVALRSHLRILPNGDIPICLYYPSVIGNLLKEQNFKTFWVDGKAIKNYRKSIRECSGCWARCEIIPNGIYTGDIIKSIF